MTETDIQSIINEMKICSPGHDAIHPRVIKYVSSKITNPLTCILNLSLEFGVFPDVLKIGKVIPLYKKGAHDIFSNYRPIC